MPIALFLRVKLSKYLVRALSTFKATFVSGSFLWVMIRPPLNPFGKYVLIKHQAPSVYLSSDNQVYSTVAALLLSTFYLSSLCRLFFGGPALNLAKFQDDLQVEPSGLLYPS